MRHYPVSIDPILIYCLIFRALLIRHLLTLVLLQQYISRNKIGQDERIIKASDATLKRWPQRFADKAGIGKFVSCHSFRHHLITLLIEDEWSYDEIQRVTCHKSISSIAHYDHAGVGVVEDKFREGLAEL